MPNLKCTYYIENIHTTYVYTIHSIHSTYIPGLLKRIFFPMDGGALITSMYQFGVELRLKSPISVCLTGECTPGATKARCSAAIGANYVRSRTKRISCCNDIVRDSFFPVESQPKSTFPQLLMALI